MIKTILRFLLLILIVIIAIILVNTFRFSKSIPRKQALEAVSINDSAVRHMSEAVQIKTVSYADSLPVDTSEYLKLRKFLERAYPLVHEKLPRQIFNQFSYLYKWEGKNKDLNPYVIMAHMDVVPVEEATAGKWTVAPFGGVIKDSTIWGGALLMTKAL